MILLHIMGYLGADPETRFTPNGQKVTTLRVATKSRKGGQEETIWWRITVWGDQFDKMMTYFKKGSAIYVVAEMQKLSIYQDKSGQSQVSYEATAKSLHFPPFNDNKGEGGEQGGNSGGYNKQQSQNAAPSYGQDSAPSPYASQRTQEGGRQDAFADQDEDSIPF